MKSNNDIKFLRGVTIFCIIIIGIIFSFDFGNNFPGGVLIGAFILGFFSLAMTIGLSKSKKGKKPKLKVNKETLDFAKYMAPSKDTDTIQIRAFVYHQFGFNVTCIKKEKSDFSNRYDIHKSPSHEWMHFEKTKQTYNELVSYDWENAIGVGIVLGYNNLRALDIDNCSNWEFIEMVLKQLGLPQDYEWVVKSGSHNGYHIIFYSEEHSFPLKNMRVIRAYRSNAEYQDMFDKIELRWSKHLVLPPSLHSSGNHYSFIFNKPKYSPKTVGVNLVEQLVCLICGTKTSTSPNSKLNLKIPFADLSSEDEYLEISSFIIDENIKNSLCHQKRVDLSVSSSSEEYIDKYDIKEEFIEENEPRVYSWQISSSEEKYSNDDVYPIKLDSSKVHLYTPSDKLTLGKKNKGLTFAQIYKYNPSHLEYLIDNFNEIILDIEAFYKLPNPTPFDTYRVPLNSAEANHNSKIVEKIFSEKPKTSNLSYLAAKIEAIQTAVFPTSVAQALKSEEKGYIIKALDYKFPQHIIDRNLEKYNNKLNQKSHTNNYTNHYTTNRSYERYNNAHGFDDDTIDSAFEGDPDNYWNID
ncbi:bifunctional DNA primase/polymerase [Marinifilum flexuosum]|uniref:bifunctional DNA primase/polymerase n=1 Tax=Marinifilum flexuosum TaxID=1117708 RepID=UPI002493F159|nr:bifunctional DNA primase/polymerase [Marinifilum flexuosum]